MYKGSIAYGQIVRFKRICSTEENLNHPEQLKQWLVKREHRKNHVYSEIKRIKLVERTVLFQIRSKTLVIV